MIGQIKGILFDLDGVLVNTLHYHYLAWQAQFDKYGAKISKHTVLLHEGRSSHDILPILLKESGLSLDIKKYDRFIENKRKYYREIVNVIFYDHAIEVVQTLKEKKYQLAIVTACAKKTMEKSLVKEIRDLFQLIQTGDDIPRSKPYPDPYDLAREKLELEKNECVVLENAPLGITSAKRAGMMCVAVETTLSQEYLSEADVIISNISDFLILPFIKNGQLV